MAPLGAHEASKPSRGCMASLRVSLLASFFADKLTLKEMVQ